MEHDQPTEFDELFGGRREPKPPEKEVTTDFHPVYGPLHLLRGTTRTPLVNLSELSSERGFELELWGASGGGNGPITYSRLRAMLLNVIVRIAVAGHYFTISVDEVMNATMLDGMRLIPEAEVEGIHGKGVVDLVLDYQHSL